MESCSDEKDIDFDTIRPLIILTILWIYKPLPQDRIPRSFAEASFCRFTHACPSTAALRGLRGGRRQGVQT